MESKREKFERLAESRVTIALKKISLVGNLSSRNNYDYTPAHIKQIFDSLEGAVKAARQRFEEPSGAGSSGFKFRAISETSPKKKQ